MKKANKNSGFTMIEMGIVLVVTALIISSVLVAQNLMKSSGSRNVIKEVNDIKISIRAFRDQYKQWPGDFNRARTVGSVTGIWETASPVTANGNHNDIIETIESLRAWQHLKLAGSNGTDSVYTGTGNYAYVTNIPRSKIGEAGYLIRNSNPYATAPYDVPPYNTDVSGSQVGTKNIEFAAIDGVTSFTGAAIDAFRASYIDTKLDNGTYNTGEVVTLPNSAPCLNYNKTSETISCRMYFRLKE